MTTTSDVVQSSSLFDIDVELDCLLDQMMEYSEQGEPVPDGLLEQFNTFCQAHQEKVDRIGRFIRMMEARETFCRNEANRLLDRARVAGGKVERTKSMVMFYLFSHELKKVEGREYTLRVQKNAQESVKVSDDAALPRTFRKVSLRLSGPFLDTILVNLPENLAKAVKDSIVETLPDNEAIKAAVARHEQVPGAEVRRGFHVRVC
jgi:hypothetical protein